MKDKFTDCIQEALKMHMSITVIMTILTGWQHEALIHIVNLGICVFVIAVRKFVFLNSGKGKNDI